MVKEYQLSYEEVLSQLKSDRNGLSREESRVRLSDYGENKLEPAKKKSPIRRILEQINDPMIIVLIAAAIISGIFGEFTDMLIILAVVVINAVLGLFQESKAERAIEALSELSAAQSRVRRSGSVSIADSASLVCGDIVLLEAGDAVPADMRLISVASLKIEEAALTGESTASEKSADALPSDAEIPLGDRHNMAYMGTNVVYGRAEGVVTATGMQTEIGKIAGILSDTQHEKTPLQKKLAALSRILSFGVIAVCSFIFLFNVLRNGGFSSSHLFDWFLTAVSLAVAAIPEGLVVVVTVLLSIGVTRMSERNAIIRRLTAVETLGCTQVICSDKTGTLTQNRMAVTAHYGHSDSLKAAMFMCNDAVAGENGSYIGDPTETALKVFALGSVLLPRIAEAPFDSDRKMMSTLHQSDDNTFVQYTKGAPDEVLKRCSHVIRDGLAVALEPAERDRILQENRAMAAKALRVIAAAERRYSSLPSDTSPPALEQNLTFIGLAGLIDPLRPEVKDAIIKCKSAGIRTLMITGDHRDTAVAIAGDLGILEPGSEAVTGAELNAMSDEDFQLRSDNIRVFARVQPEHKVRIVNSLRNKGLITAMTGDGVNDAPAIKSADIGIGMGITGTDVTKNVADMVLADDNFATIVHAVDEGRRIYENIRKAIQFLLASNLSEVISIFAATLAGFQLFAPIHILWINLVTDTLPAMALGMEAAETDSMSRPPRSPSDSIFADGLALDVIFQGFIIAALTLLSFFIGSAHSHLTAMTMAFMTLSMSELFHAFSLRSRSKSVFSYLKMPGNILLYAAMLLGLLLTLLLIYTPGLNAAFSLVPLSLSHLLSAFSLSLAIIPAVEFDKLLRFAFRKAAAAEINAANHLH